MGPRDALITPPEPTSAVNLKDFYLSKVEEMVWRARSSSVPGPSRELPKATPLTSECPETDLEEIEDHPVIDIR